MGQVTMFQCEQCNKAYKDEVGYQKCQDFHLAQKRLREVEERLNSVKAEFELTRQEVQELCPEHDFKPTGKSEQSFTMSDTKYTSREMRCSRCGHDYWT